MSQSSETKTVLDCPSLDDISCGWETPRNETIQLCQPSQFSDQYNSNSSLKIGTSDTTSTVCGGFSMNINIPPKKLFQTLPSPSLDHTQPADPQSILTKQPLPSPSRTYTQPNDSQSNLSQQSLSSTQDSNEAIFPSPPPIAFLSPTVGRFTGFFGPHWSNLQRDLKRQEKEDLKRQKTEDLKRHKK